ncbi:hypothetical protein [Gordonia humi]|uniref:Uncharacterized protein n=1 Tax=Gordonia humi TaxID=686429 RepID=A0A840EYQ4_9ACTN|nr:hypothetical protein [Gordonia humi]MBB4134129.1 hypothetical protein [Gordonia humi]
MGINGFERPRDGYPTPPFSTDLLVDFHSGLLDPDVAEHVRVGVADDPDAQRILAALDATTEDLASLRGEEIPIPPDVRARMLRVIGESGTD